MAEEKVIKVGSLEKLIKLLRKLEYAEWRLKSLHGYIKFIPQDEFFTDLDFDKGQIIKILIKERKK